MTNETGLDVANTRFSYAAAWEDYDNDGDQDLYVVNDFGRNCLYRNDGGYFENVAAAAGVEDIASGMSASWSDFDHDGHMDIYVSNMFSSAGNRITYQQNLAVSYSESARAHIQRHARGNTLFRNLGAGHQPFLPRPLTSRWRQSRADCFSRTLVEPGGARGTRS